MPSNNEYKRYFIILQEDDKGYELASGKVPTGYAKIEIKNGRGKMTAYAQNVKNGDKADYRMLLVAPNKKAAVDMGRIMVDATGRGELNVEFDADNVMKSGMNISDFMVAAVSSNTGIPLSGYAGRDKMSWKGAYNIINKTYDRMEKKTQPVQEVFTPVQMQPMSSELPQQAPPMTQMPQMPTMPKMNLGSIVEGAKNVIGNVVEGAKDTAADIVGDVVEGAKDVVEDVVGDVVQGAKNLVGGVFKGAKETVEEVAPETTMEVPMTQMPPMSHMQTPPASVQGAKGYVGGVKKGKIETVEEVAPEAVMPAPVKPAPVPPTPKQVPVTQIPIQTEVTAKPVQPVQIPIQTQVTAAPVQPVEIPIVVKPIVEQPPVQPIIMAPKKPIYETETEVKAKFVIETETEQVHYVPYEAKCEHIDYKDYYYDEESERDSDSDSDSDDDREREKHHKHHEKDHEHENDLESEHEHDHDHDHEHEHDHEHDNDEHLEHEEAMHRRLMKVLGRLRKYQPFEDEEDREEWFKVADDIYLLNNAAIPFMGSMMPLGYPYMMNDCVMMIGRKDYIIGVKYDRDRDKKHARNIMFGMPGMYNKQEEAYYRMKGFTHFRPHRSRNYGYWIMAVDLNTGRIITK